MPFFAPCRIWAGDYADCAGAAVTVITAGAAQKPGETRLDLVKKNTGIFKQIIPQVAQHNPTGIIVIATNPVDVLSYVAWKITGLPHERVIGSGTILDTARFRYLLSEYFGVDPRSVHAYIIGEHGDSMVPLWSATTIGGIKISNLPAFAHLPVKEIIESVKCRGECRSDADVRAILRHHARDVGALRAGARRGAVGPGVLRLQEHPQRLGRGGLARVNGYTTPVTVTDPGPDNTPNTGDEQTLQLYDRQPGLPQDRTFTHPDGPEYTSDYQTIEFALNRRFRGRCMALTAFGYTRMDQFYAVTSTTSALDSIGLGKAYNWIPNQRNFGDEGKDVGSLWSYKLIGRYVFNWDIGVSGSYKLQSGRNFARTISASLPVSGSQTVWVESPTAQRAPNVGILDIRLDKTFKLGRYGRLTGMLDVFNLTNSSAVTNFRITTVRYNEIIALLDPRIYRIGVRWDF